jgi:hypothetical protein
MDLQGRALCSAFHSPITNFLSSHEGAYLEIGIFYGHFLAQVANQFPDKTIYAIDPFIDDGNTTWITGEERYQSIPKVREIALHNISQVNNIELFETKTEEFINNPLAKDILKNVSCVLIDGSHHYDEIKHDLELVMQIENDYDKMVAFDDVKVDDVIRSIDDFTNNIKDRITSIDNNPDYVAVYFK